MAKGVLILMVMIGHMQNVCKELSIKDEVFVNINNLELFWGPFFMPAFFVITGFCSNFNKNFKEFILSNLKGILIPAFTLGIVARWIGLLIEPDVTFKSFLSLGIKSFVMYGGAFWFLSALFLSKMTLYALLKFPPLHKCQEKKNFRVTLLVVFILHVFGYYLFENSVCKNYWYFQHSLMMTIYLLIGQMLKKHNPTVRNKVLAMNWVGYLTFVVLILITGFESPHIANNVTVTVVTFIPHLILSVWGALLIILTTKNLRVKKTISYFGKNSLIYYCLHIKFLFVFIALYSSMLGMSFPYSIVGWVITILSTIIMCTLASYILNAKYFKILIGKF